MVKQALARSVEFEPIDRLEEKVKLLVGLVSRLRADHAKAIEENARLVQEIAALQDRIADSENTASEIAALRDERDVIRTRVSDLLDQLEHLTL